MSNVALLDFESHPEWDEFVGAHPQGWLTHLSAWHGILTSSFKNLEGGVLAVVDDGRITAGVPIYRKRSWLTDDRLVSIPFGTICDILATENGQVQELFEAAVGLLSEHPRDRYAEFRLLDSWELIRQTNELSRVVYKHHYIPLQEDFEQLRRTFHRSCVRQRIDRGQKSGLEARISDDKRDVAIFYKLYTATRKRLGLPPAPKRFFDKLWDAFADDGKIQILFAYKGAVPVSSLLLFRFKNRVSAEYACMSYEHRGFSPNHFLFWEAIKQSCIEGWEVFDFGRTEPDNLSLMDFKNRWGTTVKDIVHLYAGPGRPVEGQAPRSKEKEIVAALCKVLPSKAVVAFGNVLFQHLT